jgi:hypothetical protein
MGMTVFIKNLLNFLRIAEGLAIRPSSPAGGANRAPEVSEIGF